MHKRTVGRTTQRWQVVFAAILIATSLTILGLADHGHAQWKWERPVTIYIPASPGGTFDIVVRALQPALEAELGVPVLPVNIAGASGGTAAMRLLSDPADGYQMMIISRTISTIPYMGQPHIDPVRHFEPIGVLVQDVSAITVSVNSPFKDAVDFIIHAYENPGTIRIGTSGVGSVWHSAGMLLERATGARFEFIAYPGGNPAAQAAAAGEIEAVTVSPAEARSLVEAGLLRTLAVMGENRHPLYPDVPTLKELGIDLTYGVWRGLVARKGISPEAKAALEEAVRAAVLSDTFRQAMETAGVEVAYRSADEFQRLLEEEDELVQVLLGELGLLQTAPQR